MRRQSGLHVDSGRAEDRSARCRDSRAGCRVIGDSGDASGLRRRLRKAWEQDNAAIAQLRCYLRKPRSTVEERTGNGSVRFPNRQSKIDNRQSSRVLQTLPLSFRAALLPASTSARKIARDGHRRPPNAPDATARPAQNDRRCAFDGFNDAILGGACHDAQAVPDARPPTGDGLNSLGFRTSRSASEPIIFAEFRTWVDLHIVCERSLSP